MKITLGEKTIQAKIMDKEKAKEKYEDAMASGNQVTMLNEDDKMHQLDIGNIQPNQKAIVEICILRPLSSEDGAFNFRLPTEYFPDAKIFNFSAEILSR